MRKLMIAAAAVALVGGLYLGWALVWWSALSGYDADKIGLYRGSASRGIFVTPFGGGVIMRCTMPGVHALGLGRRLPCPTQDEMNLRTVASAIEGRTGSPTDSVTGRIGGDRFEALGGGHWWIAKLGGGGCDLEDRGVVAVATAAAGR